MRFWAERKKRIVAIRNFDAVFAPNFSVYEDAPRFEHILAIRRSQTFVKEMVAEEYLSSPMCRGIAVRISMSSLSSWIALVLKPWLFVPGRWKNQGVWGVGIVSRGTAVFCEPFPRSHIPGWHSRKNPLTGSVRQRGDGGCRRYAVVR